VDSLLSFSLGGERREGRKGPRCFSSVLLSRRREKGKEETKRGGIEIFLSEEEGRDRNHAISIGPISLEGKKEGKEGERRGEKRRGYRILSRGGGRGEGGGLRLECFQAFPSGSIKERRGGGR